MRHRRSGFTLLEVLVSLMILAALGGITLQTLAQGSQTRSRTLAYAEVRPLLEEKLAELSLLSAGELYDLPARTSGRFPAPHEAATWRVEIQEQRPRGSLLFHVMVEVSLRGATLRSATYLNRLGESWRSLSTGTPAASP